MASKVLLALPMVVLVAAAGFVAARRSSSPVASGTAEPLAERWRRVAERPESPEAWVALAEAQAALDQAAAAERSLWTAVELGEPTGLAHGRLGFLLYAQHRDEEALPLLELAEAMGADLPLLEHTLSRLRAQPGPSGAGAGTPPVEGAMDPLPSAGTPVAGGRDGARDLGVPDAGVRPDGSVREAPCAVALERAPSGGTWLLEAEVEGEPARLVVDTGASLTVITRELAQQIGAEPDPGRAITAITAGGRVKMPTAVLGDTTVAGRTVAELRVAICDDCVSPIADGLLGLDLQTSLGMQIDTASGALLMGDCDL